MNKKDEMKIW